MAFVFHDWKKFGYFAVMSVICGVGLYYFWFKNLKTSEECEVEDERFANPLGEKVPAKKLGGLAE
jgi:hypothetical protein